MNDKQRLALLRTAERHFKQTKKGWLENPVGGGSEWKAGMAALNKLERDLATVVPDLGPIWRGGKSVLLHDLTHKTSGVAFYPAFDDAFRQGEVIIAPEFLTVFQDSSANPGEAFFCHGRSRLDWWFGHLDRTHPVGTTFARGDAIGRVAANSIGGGPHCHCGISIQRIAGPGKQLVHHTDYTHGAPLIGVQLKRLFAL